MTPSSKLLVKTERQHYFMNSTVNSNQEEERQILTDGWEDTDDIFWQFCREVQFYFYTQHSLSQDYSSRTNSAPKFLTCLKRKQSSNSQIMNRLGNLSDVKWQPIGQLIVG